jgi:hypothetical protein
VHGVVAIPKEWQWPDPLPTPRGHDTSIVGRFGVRFPVEPPPRR